MSKNGTIVSLPMVLKKETKGTVVYENADAKMVIYVPKVFMLSDKPDTITLTITK